MDNSGQVVPSADGGVSSLPPEIWTVVAEQVRTTSSQDILLCLICRRF